MEYIHWIEPVVCPLEEGPEEGKPMSEQQLCQITAKKLVSYKHQDEAKGHHGFDLKVK